MKVVALILGLLAGIAGCALVAMGTLEGAVLALTGLGVRPAGLARALLLGAPELSLLATGLFLSRPAAAAIIQLICVFIWLPVVVLWTHDAILLNAIPPTLMVVAGVLGLGVAVERAHLRRRPAPVPARQYDSRNRWVDEELPAPPLPPARYAPVPAPRRVERAEPVFDFGPETEEEEDVQPSDYEDQYVRSGRHKAPQYAHYEEQEQDYVPDPPPAPRAYSREFFPQRSLEAAPQRQILDIDEYEYDSSRRHGGGWFRRVVTVFLAVVVLAIVIGAGLLYLDYQRGSRSIFVGQSKTAKAQQSPAPLPKAAAKPAMAAHIAPAAAPQLPQLPPATPPVDKPLAPPEAVVAPLPAAPAPAAASTELTLPETYSDPVTYCAAVDTINAPDARYTGPRVPPIIVGVLGSAAQSDPEQVHWRCAYRVPLACLAAKGPLCDSLPTPDEMLAHCKTNPGPAPIRVPKGSWHCEGTRPVIPPDQEWPADALGFYPPAWTKVPAIIVPPPIGG